MSESLLSPSSMLLYGRLLTDIEIKAPEEPAAKKKGVATRAAPSRPGANKFLEMQLSLSDAKLARIYGFAYEGHYYDLASPAIFLVHGDGEIADPVAADPRASRGPETTDYTGVAIPVGSYSEDMRVWCYDKGDFSIRLDAQTGPLEEILIEAELVADEMTASYSGAKVRGAKVRGAKVRGAKVRGAKVRGGWGGDNMD